jgi:hypothetical protein
VGIIKEEIAASVTLPSADTITLKSTRSKDFLHEVELEDILNRIDDLDIGTELHYVSTGKWCLHHLIQALCLKIGKGARIRITSWMITEEPARQLVSMVQNGLISKLTLILDERIMDRRPQVIQLLEQHSNIAIFFAKIHAKVSVIIKDDSCFTVVGSANLTRNPRIEVGAVFVNNEIAAFHCAWMADVMSDYENRIHSGDASGNRGICKSCFQSKGNSCTHQCKPSAI